MPWRPVVSRLNESQLRSLAEAGNGMYQAAGFLATDTQNILEAVSQQSSMEVEDESLTRIWQEYYFWLVGLGTCAARTTIEGSKDFQIPTQRCGDSVMDSTPFHLNFADFRAAQIRQGKVQSTGNGLSFVKSCIDVFGRLYSRKTTSGHLRCCARLPRKPWLVLHSRA